MTTPTLIGTEGKRVSEINAEAERFGFQARAVPRGYFLAPVTKNRFGHRHIGDDVMLVKHSGDIVPYADDAQAFFAAKAVAALLSEAHGRTEG